MFNPLSLLGPKMKMGLVVVIGLAVASGVAYHFFQVNKLNRQLVKVQEELTVTKTDLATSQANEIALENALEISEQSVEVLNQQRKIDQVKLNRLTREMNQSRKYVSDLREKLSKHDLGYLILEKPDWLENIINRGTADVGKTFTDLSAPEEKDNVQ